MSGTGDAPAASNAGTGDSGGGEGGIRRRHSASHDEDDLAPTTRNVTESAIPPYAIESPRRPNTDPDAAPRSRTSAVESSARPSIARLTTDESPRVRFSTDIERYGPAKRASMVGGSAQVDEKKTIGKASGAKQQS